MLRLERTSLCKWTDGKNPKLLFRLKSQTDFAGSSFWKQKELLRASVMSKMKSLFVEVQSVARTHVCQDSGIDDILSRQPLNVTDTGTVHMAEQTETYGRAFKDLVEM